MKIVENKIRSKLSNGYYDTYLNLMIAHQIRGTGVGVFTPIFDRVSQNVKKL